MSVRNETMGIYSNFCMIPCSNTIPGAGLVIDVGWGLDRLLKLRPRSFGKAL